MRADGSATMMKMSRRFVRMTSYLETQEIAYILVFELVEGSDNEEDGQAEEWVPSFEIHPFFVCLHINNSLHIIDL